MTMPVTNDFASGVLAAFQEEAGDLFRRLERLLHPLAAQDAAGQKQAVLEILRCLHTLKGAAAAAGMETLKSDTHRMEDQVRGLENRAVIEPAETGALLDWLQRMRQEMQVADGIGVTGEKAVVAGAAAPRDIDALRINPQRIDSLHNLVGELIVARLQHDAFTEQVRENQERMREVTSGWKKMQTQFTPLRRVMPETQWRELMAESRNFWTTLNGAGQGISALALSAPAIQAQSAALTANLEDGIRELRLMPLQPFFEEFQNVAREAARECMKQVRVVVQTGGAELDRSVLRRLRDPLLHLVRNAVVHGIELPEQRRLQGKQEVGTILLEAATEGNRVVVRIVDDGAGISVAAVRAKAAHLKLAAGSEDLSQDAALLDVLTQPGFSTRSVADNLAGRGIGLDVVASGVHELGGSLILDNLPGSGCVFTLNVPITASTGIGLIVRCGTQDFGIQMNHIERILRLGAADVTYIEGHMTVQLHGENIALVLLSGLVGLGHAKIEFPSKRPAVVLRIGKQKMAVVVDEIPGEQTMVIKPFGPAFSKAELFLGGAVLADNAILPILHVPALFRRAAQMPPATKHEAADRALQSATKKSVLVVDDSITMRTLVRSILQATGYDVTVAHDGLSALEELQRTGARDLIITDLQMPRLDGTGLCKAVRTSEQFRHTPIIMVTSVAENEEKQRALDAGADAYIVKNQFEQNGFIEMVAMLTGRTPG